MANPHIAEAPPSPSMSKSSFKEIKRIIKANRLHPHSTPGNNLLCGIHTLAGAIADAELALSECPIQRDVLQHQHFTRLTDMITSASFDQKIQTGAHNTGLTAYNILSQKNFFSVDMLALIIQEYFGEGAVNYRIAVLSDDEIFWVYHGDNPDGPFTLIIKHTGNHYEPYMRRLDPHQLSSNGAPIDMNDVFVKNQIRFTAGKGLGFVKEERRLTVTFTRAKVSLWVLNGQELGEEGLASLKKFMILHDSRVNASEQIQEDATGQDDGDASNKVAAGGSDCGDGDASNKVAPGGSDGGEGNAPNKVAPDGSDGGDGNASNNVAAGASGGRVGSDWEEVIVTLSVVVVATTGRRPLLVDRAVVMVVLLSRMCRSSMVSRRSM